MRELIDLCRYPELLQRADGYWKYLRPEFASHLEQYLPVFEKSRNDQNMVPTETVWQKLPEANGKSWQWRRQSRSLLDALTEKQRCGAILEIGAWNGWLTKHLARRSNWVVAADYFTANFDGIGNIESLAKNVSAVQCELEKIGQDFLPETFDLIVLNHNLAYSSNPSVFAQSLVQLLRPGGKIVSLGNAMFADPKKKIAQNATAAKSFEEHYGIPYYIAPLKGYLDLDDVTLLNDSGFQNVAYPQKMLQNIYSAANPARPAYFGFIFTKNERE